MSISSSQGDSMPKPMIVKVKRPSAAYKGSRFDLEKDLNVVGLLHAARRLGCVTSAKEGKGRGGDYPIQRRLGSSLADGDGSPSEINTSFP